MQYRNKATGVIIDTPCKITGGDWEAVAAKPATQKPPKSPKQAKPDE